MTSPDTTTTTCTRTQGNQEESLENQQKSQFICDSQGDERQQIEKQELREKTDIDVNKLHRFESDCQQQREKQTNGSDVVSLSLETTGADAATSRRETDESQPNMQSEVTADDVDLEDMVHELKGELNLGGLSAFHSRKSKVDDMEDTAESRTQLRLARELMKLRRERYHSYEESELSSFHDVLIHLDKKTGKLAPEGLHLLRSRVSLVQIPKQDAWFETMVENIARNPAELRNDRDRDRHHRNQGGDHHHRDRCERSSGVGRDRDGDSGRGADTGLSSRRRLHANQANRSFNQF